MTGQTKDIQRIRRQAPGETGREAGSHSPATPPQARGIAPGASGSTLRRRIESDQDRGVATVRARAIAARRERDWTMLFVATFIIALSFALQVRDDQRVELRILPGYPLPEACLTRQWFNRSCPGCGLTRSFVYLARGDWQRSLAMHRVGWLIAVAVVAQFPYRWFLLRSTDQTTAPTWVKWFGSLLIALLIGNWLANLF